MDILKENNIKATFFIIGNQINGFENVIKRIHDDGHGIGLHTYTRKFKRIYSSRVNFIKEMLDCRNEINRLTGNSPNIIRFPGGSSNRLTESYLNKLHSYNFKIYDWNMVTSDGLNTNASPNQLYRDATKYYKEKGYEFKTISENTPELYFPIKK